MSIVHEPRSRLRLVAALATLVAAALVYLPIRVAATPDPESGKSPGSAESLGLHPVSRGFGAVDQAPYLQRTATDGRAARPERSERDLRQEHARDRREERARDELRARFRDYPARLSHVEARHVSKSADYLRKRVTTERLTRASTYKDRASLLRAIDAVEADPHNREALKHWAKTAAPGETLTLQRKVGREPLGTVVERRDNGALGKPAASNVAEVRYRKLKEGARTSWEIDTVTLDTRLRTPEELKARRLGSAE